MIAMRAAKYVMLSLFLTVNAYSSDLVSRLEKHLKSIVDIPCKIKITGTEGVFAYDLEDGNGLHIELPKNLFSVTESWDVSVFLAIEAVELEKEMRNSNLDKATAKATTNAFQIFVSKTKFNPRAVLKYLSNHITMPQVNTPERKRDNTKSKLIGLLLAEWMRVDGQGSQFRLQEEPAEPLTATELKQLKTESLKEIVKIVSNPELHESVDEYILAIKENRVKQVYPYFQAMQTRHFSAIRLLSQGVLSHEKLVLYEQMHFRNLKQKFDKKIQEILGEDFHIQNAEQFFALRALYIRQPRLSIPPFAAAFFAASNPADSVDHKVTEKLRDWEYKLVDSWGDLVDWRDDRSRKDFFKYFANAFKGSAEQILQRVQQDKKGSLWRLDEHHDMDFLAPLSVRGGYSDPHLSFMNMVLSLEETPLELKVLGKFSPYRELSKFEEKAARDLLLPTFNQADLTKLPIRDLFHFRGNSTQNFLAYQNLLEKLRAIGDEKSDEIRLSYFKDLTWDYSQLSEENKKIVVPIMQQEYDSIVKAKIVANGIAQYEHALENIKEGKIPLKIEVIEPGVLELIAKASDPQGLSLVLRQWSRKDKRKITLTEIYDAAAKKLVEIKYERTKGLSVQEISDIFMMEDSWYLKEFSLVEIKKAIERLKTLAMNTKERRELINFTSLIQGLLFHPEVKNWQNEIPELIKTVEKLIPLLIGPGYVADSGIFRGHQNLSGLSDEQKQYKVLIRDYLKNTRPFDFSIDALLFNSDDGDYWKPRFRNAMEIKLVELTPHEFGKFAYSFLSANARAYKWSYEFSDMISAIGASKTPNTWLGKYFSNKSSKDFTPFVKVDSILTGWEEARKENPQGELKDTEAHGFLSGGKVIPTYTLADLSNEELITLAKWVYPVLKEPHSNESWDRNDPLFIELFNRRSDLLIQKRLLEIHPSQIFSPKKQTEFIDWRLSGLLTKNGDRPEKSKVRNLANQIFKFFNTTMKESTSRDSHVLRWVDKLALTPAEMDIVSPLLVSKNSLFDLIEGGSLKRIDNFLGYKDDPEENLKKIKMLRSSVAATGWDRATQVAYREQDKPLKTLIMYALVDESLTSQLVDMVLGELTKFPEIKKLAQYYLESLPSNERTIVLARLLANGNEDSPLNLGEMLDLIGPMGARAKQILRMLPMLPIEYRKQLDLAFDLAQPPSRYQAVEQLRELIGENFEKNVRWVGPLLGSGTLNYGLLLEMRNPKTRLYELVVARVQKENVGGHVENEDIVLKSTVAKTLVDEDQKVRRAGRVLELVRSRVYSSLNAKTGPELNQEIERRFSEELRVIDNTVVKFKNEYLSYVKESDKARISFMPFIDKVSWQSVEAKERAELAEKVVRINLKLLDEGVVDKDPSRGNELVDKNKKLHRIDTGQPLRLSKNELLALKYFASLVMSSVDRPSPKLLEYVNKNLKWIFVLPADKKLDVLETERMKIVNWSEEKNLLNRIILLAEAIDPDAVVSLRPQVADFFEVLLRINSWSEFMPKNRYEEIMVQFISGRSSRFGFVFLGPKGKPQNFERACSGLF